MSEENKDSRKSILILGGNGYIGSSIARSLVSQKEKYIVHCTYQHAVTPIPGVHYHHFSDITDKDKCRALANKTEPKIIIYCAGSNEPAPYEKDQIAAQVVFSGGPGAMITATEVMKPKFIFISSDYVFAGNESNYNEQDTPLSFSQFGKAKVGGENFVRTRSMNHLIFRCAPLMGRGPIDHPSWIDVWRESLFLGIPIKVPSKTFHNPASVHALTRALNIALDTDIKNKTLHIGGLSKVSMYELALVFAKEFEYDIKLIEISDEQSNVSYDYSINFTQTLRLLETEPLFLEQSLDLIK